jgi:hypothetical protein
LFHHWAIELSQKYAHKKNTSSIEIIPGSEKEALGLCVVRDFLICGKFGSNSSAPIIHLPDRFAKFWQD